MKKHFDWALKLDQVKFSWADYDLSALLLFAILSVILFSLCSDAIL